MYAPTAAGTALTAWKVRGAVDWTGTAVAACTGLTVVAAVLVVDGDTAALAVVWPGVAAVGLEVEVGGEGR